MVLLEVQLSFFLVGRYEGRSLSQHLLEAYYSREELCTRSQIKLSKEEAISTAGVEQIVLLKTRLGAGVEENVAGSLWCREFVPCSWKAEHCGSLWLSLPLSLFSTALQMWVADCPLLDSGLLSCTDFQAQSCKILTPASGLLQDLHCCLLQSYPDLL